MCPEMVFNHRYHTDVCLHVVIYRPAFLNGRHIVDVLRAVCGPADVREAELDRVSREATKMKWNWGWLGEGVWVAQWRNVAVIARK